MYYVCVSFYERLLFLYQDDRIWNVRTLECETWKGPDFSASPPPEIPGGTKGDPAEKGLKSNLRSNS